MTDAIGVNFFYDWELRLMEWLQAVLPGDGPLFWLLSNLSAFGEQLLMVVIMGFLYWGLNKEFGKYVGVNVLAAGVWGRRALPGAAVKNPPRKRRFRGGFSEN